MNEERKKETTKEILEKVIKIYNEDLDEKELYSE